MAEEPDPPRKTYGFKERTFPRDNPPATQLPPTPTAQDLARLAGPVARQTPASPSPKAGLPAAGQAKAGLPAVGQAKAGDPNDVEAVLAHNRVVEQRHGFDHVEIREVQSRRKRDYWLLLIGGNVAIAGTVLVLGANIVSAMFGFGGMIIFSLSLTWIMWQVMGRY